MNFSKGLAAAIAIGFLCVFPAQTKSAPSSLDPDITQLYANYKSALERFDADAAKAILATGFQSIDVGGEIKDARAFGDEITRMAKIAKQLRVEISIQSVRVVGDSADVEVTVRETAQFTPPGSAKASLVVAVNREQDHLVRSQARWLLASSKTLEETQTMDGKVIEHAIAAPKMGPAYKSALLRELRQVAVPVRSVVPSQADDDLQAFGNAIGSARLVALGEATHGTSEFFSLKDRLFRYLVKRKGFTIFAMEANWSDGVAIDRYVQGGLGDPHALLSRTFAVWDNAETAELLRWIRTYNQHRGKRPGVRFIGIDMQTPTAAAEMVTEYFRQAHSPDASAVAADLACIGHGSPQEFYAQYTRLTLEQRQACASSAVKAYQTLATNAAALRPASTTIDFTAAQHAGLVVMQSTAFYASEDQSNARDDAMSANIIWAANLHPLAKIAIWAHNGHVMASPSASANAWKVMGARLREHFGSKYYALGFAFDHGTISPNGVAPIITVPRANATAVEAILRDVGPPVFFLRTNARKAPAPLSQWLLRAQPLQQIGAINSSAELSDRFNSVSISKAFDGLIFVRESHAAHSFEIVHVQPNSAHSETLTLQKGEGGPNLPARWGVTGASPSAYTAVIDHTTRHGTSFGSISIRSKGDARNTWATIAANFPLATYLGKRVRISGYIKTSGVSAPGAAFWMRVGATGGGDPLGFDNMMDRPIMSSTWTPFSIVLDVPTRSADIVAGLLLFGPGTAWADDITIEPVSSTIPLTKTP